jgi:glycyl-tRNA synthetase
MFETQMGPVKDSGSTVYLRPETAQGIFTNFLNVQTTMRRKLPFGIAQIGKAFRNEITPGNFIFRTREFEQMEMQYFIKPGTQKEAMEKWKEIRWQWHLDNGLDADKLRWHDHGDELAHYADAAFDIEYHFPIGWDEMEGIHSRTDFDLARHQEFSGKNLQYVDQQDGNKKYIPYVLETSVGCDRHLLALMCNAYHIENKGTKEERVVMKFKPHMAPIKVAIMPLMKKPQLEEPARKILETLQKKYRCEYDVAGSIGKRYRRQDEIGTPYCITFDYDSLEDHAVTIRDRDSMTQERIKIDEVEKYILNKFGF